MDNVTIKLTEDQAVLLLDCLSVVMYSNMNRSEDESHNEYLSRKEILRSLFNSIKDQSCVSDVFKEEHPGALTKDCSGFQLPLVYQESEYNV